MSEFIHVPHTTSSSTMPKSDSEKQETVITVKTISPPGTTSSDAVSEETPWESGVRKRFPWVGFGAIVVVLNCTMATLLVLRFSNNQAASQWCGGHIEPNVFLSIFNSITNIAITVAVANGIAIAWWRRALAGQTMKELHYSWSFSMSFVTILTKLRYFNIIALAALATKIAVIDSVLYQRSLGTAIAVDDQHDRDTSFTFAAQVFPITASMGPTPGSIGVLQPEFAYNLYNWLASPLVSTSLNAIAECDAYQCGFALPAAGFSVDCTDSWQEIDYGTSAPKALVLNQSSGYQDLPLFSTKWAFTGPSSNTSSSSILLQMTYATALYEDEDEGSESSTPNVKGGSCPTRLTTSTCVFKPAVLNYTVMVTNQKSATKYDQDHRDDKKKPGSNKDSDKSSGVGSNLYAATYDASSSLGLSCNATYGSTDDYWCGYYNETWRQVAGVKVIQTMDVAELVTPYANSTLYGFYLAFKDYFTSSATIDWNGKDWSYVEDGQFAFYSGDSTSTPPAGYCNYSYYDIRDFLVQQINMLTLSIATDPYSYYPHNPDFTANSTNPVARMLYYATTDNYTDLITDMKIAPEQILKARLDLQDPLPGFDPKQANLQPISVHKQYKDVFYISDWNYAFGAIAATAIVILCIIPVYWRFWDLGRKVTLGPFEIAYAFQSPAFSGIHGAAGEADVVLKHVGKNKVKYVEVTDETGRKYAFQPVQV